MDLNKDIIEELELKEIPVNIILKATCKSPPGIKINKNSLNKGRDYLGYRKTVLNKKEDNLKFESDSKIIELCEDNKIDNFYSRKELDNVINNNSNKEIKRIIPKFELPINNKIMNRGDNLNKKKNNLNITSNMTEEIYIDREGDNVNNCIKKEIFIKNNKDEDINKRIESKNENLNINGNLNVILDNDLDEDRYGYMNKDNLDYSEEFFDYNRKNITNWNIKKVESETNSDDFSGKDNLIEENVEMEDKYKDMKDNLENRSRLEIDNNLEYIRNINKYIPISSRCSTSNGYKEIKIDNADNRDKYESLFKDELEFSELFDKFWEEAGNELRKENNSNNYDNKYINPIPFQSDLLNLNKKRGIKTIIPFDKIKKNKDNQLNLINQIELFKSLKNEDLEDNSNQILYQEEMSTRASSMNNIFSNKYNEITSNNNMMETYRSLNNINNVQEDVINNKYPLFVFKNRNIESCENKIEEIKDEFTSLEVKNDLKMNKFEDFLTIEKLNNKNRKNEKSIEKLRNYIENEDEKKLKSTIFFKNEDIDDIYKKKTLFKIESNSEDDQKNDEIDFKKNDENHEVKSDIKIDIEDYDNGFDKSEINNSIVTEVDIQNSPIPSSKHSLSTFSSSSSIKHNHIISVINNKTKIYNALDLTQYFQLIFQKFNLNRITSEIETNELESENANFYNSKYWLNTRKDYEKLSLFYEKKNLILILLIITNIILISISNIIIPIIYNINNLFTLVILNPIINFIIFYIFNGISFYIFIKKVYHFNKSTLNDYLLLLGEINKIRRKNFHKSYDEEDDIIEQIFNQLLHDYISYMRDIDAKITNKYRNNILIYFNIGLIQTIITLSINVFVINMYNRKALLFNINNIISILLTISFFFMILKKRYNEYIGWNLKDAFHRDIILKVDGIIQNKQLQLLTFTTCVIELILYNNYILNHFDDNRNKILNISLHEMEQYKLLNKININNLDLNILCRIHFQVDENHNYISKQLEYNNLWPFVYLKYNKEDKTLIMSSNNNMSIINQKIPVNLISIEFIQSSIFPWLLIHDNFNQNEQNYILINDLRRYLFNENLFISKDTESNFNKHLNDLIENYNFISFTDITESNSFDKEYYNYDDELKDLNKSDNIKNQNLYFINCNSPKEIFENSLKESKEEIKSQQIIRFQIICFSFNDLLNIYRIIN